MPDSTLTPVDGEEPSREMTVVNSSSPHSFSVQWQAGANNGEKINNFEVTYYQVRGRRTWGGPSGVPRDAVCSILNAFPFVVCPLFVSLLFAFFLDMIRSLFQIFALYSIALQYSMQ